MYLKLCIFICLSLLLASCAAPYSSASIPQDTVGTYFRDKFTMEAKLYAYGVEIVEVGDRVTIMIPNDRVFKFDNPTIRADSKSFLNLLACYLTRYGGVNMTIAVYSDNVGPFCHAKILSQYRAQSFAAFLWVRGFPPQNVHPIGQGMCPTIADNDTVRGNRLNRRIEICFWKSLA